MKTKFLRALPSLLLILGSAAVSAGIGIILRPAAGIIAAGVFLIAGGVLTAMGSARRFADPGCGTAPRTRQPGC